jgi:hypothetical protein
MTLTRVLGAKTNNDYAVVQWQPTAAQIGTNTFTVAATNANTTGGRATFTVVVLPNGTDFIPPTPVAQMTASLIASDRCNLAWTPAGDNIGVARYHLVATHFGSPSNHVASLSLEGTITSTVLTGLLASAGYTIVITAEDAAGNVSSPTSIFLTTLAQPTLTMRLTPGVASGNLNLSWNNPGTQFKFIVESSDSATSLNWQPVAPASQWPIAATSFVITPTQPAQFFRIKAVP